MHFGRIIARLGEMPRGGLRVDRRELALFVILIAALAAVLWTARWMTDRRHASGDTFWYTRQALQLSGMPRQQATLTAADFIVSQGRGNDPAAWVDATETVDPRYQAIFESRPVYPLTAAPLVPLVGANAMAISALIAGVVFAIAFAGTAWWATGSKLAGASAVTLAFVLPSGRWLMQMIADGWMLAAWAVALLSGALYLSRGRWGALLAFVVSLVLLYGTKSANGALVAGSVAVVAGLSFARYEAEWRRAATLAGVAVGVAVAQVIAFAALGLPGLNEALQDLFTNHFTVPDVDRPLQRLLPALIRRAPGLLAALVPNPLVPIGVVAGLTALVLVRRRWAAFWVIAGLASLLAIVIHPVISEVPRLMAPLWVSVALGGALATAAIQRIVRPPGTPGSLGVSNAAAGRPGPVSATSSDTTASR